MDIRTIEKPSPCQGVLWVNLGYHVMRQGLAEQLAGEAIGSVAILALP
jgi:hypothetical protein